LLALLSDFNVLAIGNLEESHSVDALTVVSFVGKAACQAFKVFEVLDSVSYLPPVRAVSCSYSLGDYADRLLAVLIASAIMPTASYPR
jgi:hypothetical protein